jgi:hypothetical protein
VVQQKQGRVQPTMQLQGVSINDNEGLEREADIVGEKVLQRKITQNANNIHVSKCENIIQRTHRKEDRPGNWKTYSSFDKSFTHPLQDVNNNGVGGALTIFLNGREKFSHRILSLEWHDGAEGREKNIVVHLNTPALQGHYWGKTLNQISSIIPFRGMKSTVETLNWDLEQAARKEHRTQLLNENQKEEKRQLIESEIGKEYNYSISGGFFKDTYNCRTWARKIAPECDI